MAFARRAEIELAASNKRLRADLRQAETDIASFGKRSAGKLSGAFRSALGGFAAFGTIGGFAALGKDVLDFEEKLTRLGIASGASGGKLTALRADVEATALATGMSRAEVLGAVDALVNLQGTAGFSAEKMRVLAKAAQATGNPIGELAGLAFALGNSFDIDASQLEGALNAMIRAGKEGAVPLGEMNTVAQQIGANFAKIAGKGKLGVAQLASAIQVGRRGFGSAAEVGTGIKAFTDQLEQAAPALATFGVKVFKAGKDGKKEFNDVNKLLDQFAKSRLMKDPTMLARVFGSSEARQFLRVMLDNRQAFDEFAQAAMNANDINQDLDAFLSSNAGKLKLAMAQARSELEGLITPERVEKFVGVVQKLVSALEYVVDHLEQIVMLVGALKVAQLAMATNKWGQAMAGMATSAGKAADGVTGIAGATNTAQRGMPALVGGFAKMASHAAGIVGAFTAGWQVGNMLVEMSGMLEDETATKASADDPEAKADAARVMLKQQRDTVKRLEAERARAASFEGSHASPEFHARRKSRMADLDQQIRFERGLVEAGEAELTAQTIFQRNNARGTNANDDVLAELEQGRVNEMLARVGSGIGGGGTTVGQSAIIKEFAPEMANLSDEQRGRVQARLQAMLAEETAAAERKRALDEKVAGTAPSDLAAIAAAVKAGIESANVQVSVNGDAVFTANQNAMAPRRSP